MNVERICEAAHDEAALLNILYDETEKGLLGFPVEAFCTHGGWPKNISLATIAMIESSRSTIEASLFVNFVEAVNGCCDEGGVDELRRVAEFDLIVDCEAARARLRVVPRDGMSEEQKATCQIIPFTYQSEGDAKAVEK